MWRAIEGDLILEFLFSKACDTTSGRRLINLSEKGVPRK
jgi:hypothetical protein